MKSLSTDYTDRFRLLWLLRGALVLVTLLAVAPSASAGTCFFINVRQGFEQARAVFVGQVVEVVPPRNEKSDVPTEHFHTVKFKIEKTWKGSFWTEATLLAAIGDTAFGIPPMRAGERYLVYAGQSDVPGDEIVINSCSRTTLLTDNAGPKDLLLLDTIFILPSRPRVPFPEPLRFPGNRVYFNPF